MKNPSPKWNSLEQNCYILSTLVFRNYLKFTEIKKYDIIRRNWQCIWLFWKIAFTRESISPVAIVDDFKISLTQMSMKIKIRKCVDKIFTKQTCRKSLSWFLLHINDNNTWNDATGWLCCEKSVWINRNKFGRVFWLMGFPEFTVNHVLQWEFRFIILEVAISPRLTFKPFL